MPKFRRATPPNSEVISGNLLHFKPIGDSLARVKIWGRSTP